MLLAFVLLTALDGSPVWIDATPGVVQIIRLATSQCHKNGGSGIQVGSVAMCVRESPEEIKRKLKEAEK